MDNSLSPQQVQAFNQATGWNTPTTPTAPANQSRADEILALGKSKTPTPAAPSYASKVTSNLGDTFNQGAENVTKDITNIPKAAADAGGGPIADVAAPIAAAGHVAGDIAGTAGNIIGSFISPLLSDNAKKTMGDVSSYIGSKINSIPGMTPEIQKSLGDVFNTVSLLGGEKVAPTPESIAEGASSATSKAGDVIDQIKSKMGDMKDAKTAANEAKSLQTSIQDTMPLQDKATRVEELKSSLPDSGNGTGGVNRKGVLGNATPQASAQDIQRGTIAHEFIGGETDPLKKIQNLNQGIQDTSGKVINPFLDKNAAPANFEDMRNYMESNKPSESLQSDPGASESYNRATNNALNTLYKTMKKTANDTGDFGPQTSGADIRQTRIAVDQQIKKELGENVFGSPQYKGIKAAEVDTRNMLNKMSEDMLRYPGQLENLNKMNDFVSEAKTRGIEVDMKNPEVKAALEKQFGLQSTAEGDKNAQFLSDQHAKMSNLYEARDNMIDKYQTNVGKNKIQEFMKNNPKKTKVAKIAGTAILGGEALKHLGLIP